MILILSRAGRPLDWNSLWKQTGMTRGVFGRRLVECVENGWVTMGGTVRDHRLVSLFEPNRRNVALTPFGVTRIMSAIPYSRGKLRKREVLFRAGKPGVVRDYWSKPAKYHLDRIKIVDRATVSLRDLLAKSGKKPKGRRS